MVTGTARHLVSALRIVDAACCDRRDGWLTVSSVPIYLQVSHKLRQLIRSGEWPPGHPLPSQAELTRQYGVSVVTARAAVGVLRDEGLVVTRQGLGSFVRGDRPGVAGGSAPAVSTIVRHAGPGDPADGVVESVLARMPTPQEAREHHIVAGVPVLVVTRRRLAGSDPGQHTEVHARTVLPADRTILNYVVRLDPPDQAVAKG